MSADAYSDRRQIEDKIARLDKRIERHPYSRELVLERQYWARIAMFVHARIERQEAQEWMTTSKCFGTR